MTDPRPGWPHDTDRNGLHIAWRDIDKQPADLTLSYRRQVLAHCVNMPVVHIFGIWLYSWPGLLDVVRKASLSKLNSALFRYLSFHFHRQGRQVFSTP